jgi:molybdopterin-binding protein
MNNFQAEVIKINSLENLTIVQFLHKETILSMMSLGLSNIQVGTKVNLCINASHIAIAKDFQGDISLSNRFNCIIKKLVKGELLSSISLDFKGTKLTSIITTNSVNRMNLKENDEVTALVKASELSIQKVIS